MLCKTKSMPVRSVDKNGAERNRFQTKIQQPWRAKYLLDFCKTLFDFV